MTHDERIALIADPPSDEWDYKARVLWLIEDLISKVEALTDRTPDFRTKEECTIAPDTHREGTCYNCGKTLTLVCPTCSGLSAQLRAEAKKGETNHDRS